MTLSLKRSVTLNLKIPHGRNAGAPPSPLSPKEFLFQRANVGSALQEAEEVAQDLFVMLLACAAWPVPNRLFIRLSPEVSG